MPPEMLSASLGKLRDYFRSVMPEGRKPRAIFHGAEPLMNREAVFAAIDEFSADFVFGLQTNGTLLDDAALEFLTSRNVSIGLSLDGPFAGITDANAGPTPGTAIKAPAPPISQSPASTGDSRRNSVCSSNRRW